MNPIDVVMTTRNRPDYLQRTVERLFEATRAPFALHVVDDASDDEATVPYLLGLWGEGRLASLTLRKERAGLMANKNLSTWLALSDPFVIMPDDVLCPILDPDWLSISLETFARHPEIACLDLRHPGAYNVVLEEMPDVTYCEVTGGLFALLRRRFIDEWHLPHYRHNFGAMDDVLRCGAIRAAGYRVAYLNDVYCYHIGENSAATGTKYGGPFVPVKDWGTLEPQWT